MIGLRDARAILSDVSPHINDSEGLYNADSTIDEALDKWSKSIKEEMDTLETEFVEVGNQLDELRGMVSSHHRVIW